MPDLSKLGLTKDVIGAPVEAADLPQQMGMYQSPLPPGPYVFALPHIAALKGCFDVVKDTKEPTPDGKELEKVQRLVAVFRDDAALEVVQAPGEKGKDLVGRKLRQRITNVKRRRGKRDDPAAKLASDMDYLLTALGEKKLPAQGDNPGYGQALLKYPGKRFGADVEYSFQCRDDKPIRVESEPDDNGNTQRITLDGQDGRKLQNGCGTRYYQNDVKEKDENGVETIPTQIICTCGALLYCNENLSRFRAVSAQ